MTKQFYSRQEQIRELEQLILSARKSKNWGLEAQYNKAYFEIKDWQKEVISYNWSFIIDEWFETKDMKIRLDLLKKHGIVKTTKNEFGQEKFLSQVKERFVRTPITRAKEIRLWTYWRDNAECVYCKKSLDKKNSQIDHIIPHSAWPTEFLFLADDSSNLVASCTPCNRKKLNFLSLPDSEILHVEFNKCLPARNALKSECPNSQDESCKTCFASLVEVYCNVHGLCKMQLCQLSAFSKIIGHGVYGI